MPNENAGYDMASQVSKTYNNIYIYIYIVNNLVVDLNYATYLWQIYFSLSFSIIVSSNQYQLNLIILGMYIQA